MTNKPIFKPGNSTSCKLGDEVLNANIHWRNTLLELLRYSDYTLGNIAEKLVCSVSALLLVLNYNDSSLLNFKQGARLLTMHDKAINTKNEDAEKDKKYVS